MKIDLQICNPSERPRSGHVTAPLGRLGVPALSPGRVAARAGSASLSAQVDEVVKGDTSSRVLSILLQDCVKAGDANYATPGLTVSLDTQPAAGKPRPPGNSGPTLDMVTSNGVTTGVKLVNERLTVWFNLVPSLNDPGQHWYAGAATSVLLGKNEVLDPNPFFLRHEWEKRCMQLDRIRLPQLDVPLAGQSYDIVGQGQGPVRATFTAASEPFTYHERRPFAPARALTCRVYRNISLYAEADYLVEEIFVRGKAADEPGTVVPLTFIPRYFTYLNAPRLRCSCVPGIPDWFAVASLIPPFPSYGFATDVHSGPVAQPHPGYPNAEQEEKTFSWELLPCVHARCAHLFMHPRPAVREMAPGETIEQYERERADEVRRICEDRIGNLWWAEIFKPLGLRRP
jgi:hypothetical protein